MLNHQNLSLIDIVGENWKAIKDYEGLYEVSDKGRVKSLDRLCWNGRVWHKFKGRILKQSSNKRGHMMINLSKKNVDSGRLVSRLVAQAFIPNPLNLPEVDHIIENFDKSNNNVENLQWMTSGDNNRKYSDYKRNTNPNALPKLIVKTKNEKYKCSININGKRIYIGMFNTLCEAKHNYKIVEDDNSKISEYRKKIYTRGVSQVKKTRKWKAYYCKGSKVKSLGTYATKEEAESARLIFLKTAV